MYQALANFKFSNPDEEVIWLINRVIDAWRYNGQIIGREFGITLQTDDHVQVRVAIPEQESLLAKWNNDQVESTLAFMQDHGIELESYEIVGRDFQSTPTSEQENPEYYVLYTNHLESCSPIKDPDFFPVPLYKLNEKAVEFSKAIIKWQEDWQACDQLQMNGNVLEKQAIKQMSEITSDLTMQGLLIKQVLEEATKKPVYYYLYRLGKNKKAECARKCPVCEGKWLLDKPLNGVLHFKCDHCRLVSNISWEVLG